jgi:hypothetical protein
MAFNQMSYDVQCDISHNNIKEGITNTNYWYEKPRDWTQVVNGL